MLSFLFKKFSGRHHRKYVEKCRPIVTRINEFELQYQQLTDEQLRAKTDEFRARIAQGAKDKAWYPYRGSRECRERVPSERAGDEPVHVGRPRHDGAARQLARCK